MNGTGAQSHLVPGSVKSLGSTVLSITLDFCLFGPLFLVLQGFNYELTYIVKLFAREDMLFQSVLVWS